jgi:hypothetical protein
MQNVQSVVSKIKNEDDHIVHILNFDDPLSVANIRLAVPSKNVDDFHSIVFNGWKATNAHKVKQFTEESLGKECPNNPQKMTKNEVVFIAGMVISEMVELLQTVCETPEETIETAHNCVGVDFNLNYKKPYTDVEIIAEQGDAMVDAWYYMLNAAAKKGINLSNIFDVVHAANMAKRGPDGKFHKREDGKIIKPDTWKEPDIVAEIERQQKVGF